MNARVVNLESNLVPVPGAAVVNQVIGGTAAALPALDERAGVLFWSIDGGAVRVWFNGDTPTASVGHLISDGSAGSWSRAMVRGAKLIAASGTPRFSGTQME